MSHPLRLLAPGLCAVLVLAACPDEDAQPADGSLDGRQDVQRDSGSTDRSRVDGLPAPDSARDAGPAGGGFAWLQTFASGYSPGVANGRFPVVPLSGGGWVIGLSYNRAFTVAGVSLTPGGRWDAVVIKVDAQGKPVWATDIKGNDEDNLEGLAVDAQGDVYVAGTSFSSSLSFGNGVTVAGSAGSLAAVGFVAKLDSSGLAKWARRVRTGQGINTVRVAARAGKVVLVGHHVGGYPFYYTTSQGEVAGPTVFGYDTRVFVIALSPTDGLAQWLTLLGGDSNVEYPSVAIDSSGQAVVAGLTNGGAFKDQTLTTHFTTTGLGPYGFIALLSATGTVQWARALSGTGAKAFPEEVATDGAGHIAVTGSFSGTIDFGKGARTAQGSDAWAVSVSPSTGATVWDKAFGTAGNEYPRGLAFDEASGRIVLDVELGAAAATGGSIDALALPTSAGTYVVKLDTTGKALWLTHVAAGSATLRGGRLAVGTGGTTALLGTFKGTVDFGGGGVTSASGTSSDAFLLGLKP